MPFKRIIWIVLDSVGIGSMPDWREFGDDMPSDTLGNCAKLRPLCLPNLAALGIANIRPMDHLEPAATPRGAYGRCALASPGKDTTTGHWEMAGILLTQRLPTYPNGFPADFMAEYERRIGRGTLGNFPASGTDIIRDLGPEHIATGKPIVYTSADSVFQIAAHEEVIPIPELYRMCEIAREMLTGPHEVGRVIARPFIGQPGAFTRTSNRHDYAVAPPPGMLLDQLALKNVPVVSVGKIADIFLGRGVTSSNKTKTNADGMAQTLTALAGMERGLLFANLVDFDMLYGHRNDAEGYSKALEAADAWLPQLDAVLKPGDLVILTADHGCDPTTPSTDHSREYVPVLAYGPSVPAGVDLGTRASLADIGKTVAANFDTTIPAGVSFLDAILPQCAAGSFEVKLARCAPDDDTPEAAVPGRMTIDKQFHGDLEASSRGQMLAAGTDVKGSAGYVAMERVTGSLHGRTGTFILLHTGIMDRGTPQLSVVVVPDSGTGELVGLTGKMSIDIVDRKHFYKFEYKLSGEPAARS